MCSTAGRLVIWVITNVSVILNEVFLFVQQVSFHRYVQFDCTEHAPPRLHPHTAADSHILYVYFSL